MSKQDPKRFTVIEPYTFANGDVRLARVTYAKSASGEWRCVDAHELSEVARG